MALMQPFFFFRKFNTPYNEESGIVGLCQTKGEIP